MYNIYTHIHSCTHPLITVTTTELIYHCHNVAILIQIVFQYTNFVIPKLCDVLLGRIPLVVGSVLIETPVVVDGSSVV